MSIIIPAYNMETLLPRCLDSLILDDELMQLFEVLVINDGSKDSSSEIAHKYEKKYPDIFKVVDKENGNYGSCMNVALKMAQGKYFRTLDADDWFDKEEFIKYLKEAQKSEADMLLSESWIYYVKNKKLEKHTFDEYVETGIDLPMNKSFIENRSIRHKIRIHNICYKTDLLRLSGLEWSENVFYSDNEHNYWPLRILKTIRFVKCAPYIYFVGREGQSVDVKGFVRNFNSFDVVANKILDDFIKNADGNSQVYPFQLGILNGQVLNSFYKILFFNKYKENVDVIEEKLKKKPGLYEYIGDKVVFYNLQYLKAYRNDEKFKFAIYKFLFMQNCKDSIIWNILKYIHKIIRH